MTETPRRTIRIDADEWRAAKVLAAQTDQTMSGLVREALEMYRRLRPIEDGMGYDDVQIVVAEQKGWDEREHVLRPVLRQIDGPLILYAFAVPDGPSWEELADADAKQA